MDGKREGSGELVGKDGERYKGEWKSDKKHGRGHWRSQDGDTYDGHFVDGLPSTQSKHRDCGAIVHEDGIVSNVFAGASLLADSSKHGCDTRNGDSCRGHLSCSVTIDQCHCPCSHVICEDSFVHGSLVYHEHSMIVLKVRREHLGQYGVEETIAPIGAVHDAAVPQPQGQLRGHRRAQEGNGVDRKPEWKRGVLYCIPIPMATPMYP